MMKSQELIIQTVSTQCVAFEWTGPWPTLHAYVLYFGYVVLHITFDLLNTFNILEEHLIDLLLLQYGLPFDFLFGLLLVILEKADDLIVFVSASLLYVLALGMFKVADFTFSLVAYAVGLLFMTLSLVSAHILTEIVYGWMRNWIGAAAVYLGIFMVVFGLFINHASVPGFLGKASHKVIIYICTLLDISRKGYFADCGVVTNVMQILMLAISVYYMICYILAWINDGRHIPSI